MNLKTKINGHKAQIIFEDVELKNSSIYQLMLSENAKENIKAEIERLDNDIELALAIASLKHNFSEVYQIINGNDSNSAEKEITERFKMKADHVQEFLKLGFSELSGVNLSIICEALSNQKSLYQGILNDYFEDK